MQGLRLTAEAVSAGADTLESNKLKPSQIEDLVSVFRGYLGSLADEYDDFSDKLASLTDSATSNTCAKLAAFLLVLQPNGFDNGGFAATNANRSGFNYSIDEANFLAFKYAFGLLYTIPDQLVNPFQSIKNIQKPSWGISQRIITG